MKINIIGCGISGITSAILLKEQGHDVEIFETREHIGGNCYDEVQNNVTVHKYGAHIFHTNDKQVWDFVTRYTKFNDYTHRVRANTSVGLISIPYNKTTTEQIGRELSDDEIRDIIFKDYTERHWGVPYGDVPRSIRNRVPHKRDNYDDRYFSETYQGIPVNGYTDMFNNMLDGIQVNVGVPVNWYKKLKCDLMVYTGKPDVFFNYEHGKLPYRSLRFEHYVDARDDRYSFSDGAVINECNTSTYNRTIDNSVFLNETQGKHTVYTRDYPEEHDDTNEPIYPKNFGTARAIFDKYKQAMMSEKNVIFIGRLATYKYLDMWMAIKQCFNTLCK